MILNILTEEKFTDYAISQFSAPELHSDFVLIPSNHANWQVNQIDKCKIIQQRSKEFESLLNRLDQYTGIMFHGMFWRNWQQPILERVPKNVKVAWVFWGGEIYGRSDCTLSRYAPITNLVVRIREIMNGKKKCVNTSWELPIELFKRIDYCLTDELEEYEYVREFLKNEHMQHRWYNYYDLDATLGALKNESCNGNNVIVGNSATDTSNYFDVIPFLSKHLQKDQKVILPLSYGAPWIMRHVPKYAKLFLGKTAMPLLEFMPRDEYNKVLQSCSVMIMNQYIPQAQGNIITGLWLGMRVYLSENNMTYRYFKRIGCKIYSIERDLNRKNPDAFAPMKQEDIEINRSVLRKWYSKEEMHKRNLDIVRALS